MTFILELILNKAHPKPQSGLDQLTPVLNQYEAHLGG